MNNYNNLNSGFIEQMDDCAIKIVYEDFVQFRYSI